MKTKIYAIVVSLAAAMILSCGSSGKTGDLPDGEFAEQTDSNEFELFDAVEEDAVADESEISKKTTINGVEIVPQKGALSASNGLLEILIHPGDGTFDLLDKEGLYIFKDAFSKAVFLKEGKQKTITTADSVLTYIIAYKAIADNLGKGAMIEISFFGFEAGLSLIMRFHLYGGESFVNVSAAIEVPDGQEMFLAELTPVYADYESGGAFFLGANPGVHRILDNGYDKYFDFDERLALAGDNFSPIYGPGNVSNWNNLVYDPESGKSMASGFLKFARSYGLITVDYVPDKSVADSFSRSSFSFFSARCLYEPAKSLKKTDEPFESEALSIDFSKGTPHENLESYAARVAKFNGKKVWQQGHEIPTGWNSWGEHGRDIDEEMILENLDLMVKDFQPFGMEYFHIDDGWQVAYGDWVTNKNRFPDHDGVDGMKWLAEKIRSYGLKPGLWIAPFWAKSDSTLIEDHPEWLLPLQKDAALFVPEDTYPLDISNPQVKEWLKEIFERVVNDWGYEWIKLDFGYYVMFGKEFYEMDKTAAEIYREGLQLIKDILGEDRFLLSVAIMGLNYDIADGMRLTLDNKPYWGDPYLPGEQGIKVTVRSAARRYYLNYLWLNHPDLVYFRTDEGMTMNEAIAFASFSGLFGGIVKFGESFVTMHPHDEWLKVARSLIPVYKGMARPLDLFELEYPELWKMDVKTGAEEYAVIGLFNWGKNKDIGQNTEIEEKTADRKISFEEIGLEADKDYLFYEFWERKFYGIRKNSFEIQIEPRTAKVFAVRKYQGAPQVIGTDRHILMGAVEIEASHWEESSGTLKLELKGAPSFDMTLTLFVPEGYSYKETEIFGATEKSHAFDPATRLLTLTITPFKQDIQCKMKF